MTQPVDPAFLAAVIAALREQGIGRLAPDRGGRTRLALCCKRCGGELPNRTWRTYLTHCAANHQVQVERFAAGVPGVTFDVALSQQTNPSPIDAWTKLARDLIVVVTDWPVDQLQHLEDRNLPDPLPPA